MRTGFKTFRLYLESKSTGSVANTGALGLVHVADNSVGRMRDDGAEDSSNVTSSEGDDQLLRLAALGARLRHHILVDGLHSPLETGKLHHGVGDLSAPERDERLVEAVESLLLENERSCCPESGGEGARRRGLHSHLQRERVERRERERDTRTLTHSMGDRAMSAKNSAEAEAAK